MSPRSAVNAIAFRIDSDGYLNGNYVNNSYGVRPVINIRSDIGFTGSGTTTDPYKIL